MQQIRDIFAQCDTALQVVINNYNDAIDQFTDSIDSDKAQVKKLRAITKAFTSLVSDSKESSCIFRILYSECEKQPRNTKTISNLQHEYDRCKNRTFMQIGFLNNALSPHLNNQNATDNYMLKSENMTKLNEMLVSTELLDDLDTNNMDLLQELEETQTQKMPKSASTSKMSHSFKKSELPELDEVDDLFEEGLESEEEDMLGDQDLDTNLSEEEDDFGTEIPEDSIFSDTQIKEGGLNDNSDVVVSAGGATHVVGEKYKTYVRDTFLRMRNAEDRDEQIKLLGHSDEDELEAMVQRINESYALDLIAQSGVADIFIESLDNFEDRVKSQYGFYKRNSKKSDSKVDVEYKKILISIGKTRINPLHWVDSLNINDDLRKFIDATLANAQKETIKQHIDQLKPWLVETNRQMIELNKKKPVKMPEAWSKPFTIEESKSDLDPIKRLITIQKRWVPIMVEVELYLGKSAEYLDTLWPLRDVNTTTVADLKYRIYLFSKLKDQTHKKAIDTLIKKFNIGEYASLKDLADDI